MPSPSSAAPAGNGVGSFDSANPAKPADPARPVDPGNGSRPADRVGPVGVSAQGLHESAVQAFRIGNRGRLTLCESLRGLSETRLYFDLGFPSLAAYADAFFQLRRSESYEYVRVATALADLTQLRDAFARGKVGWSVVKAVTRVAKVKNQTDWINFARKHGGERTLAEARYALQRGRHSPRDGAFGLPNLDQRLVLHFPHSDMEKVRAWFDATCARVSEKTGAKGVTAEQALLFLCEQDMAPSPAADAATGADGEGMKKTGKSQSTPRAQIVYRRCPDCRRAHMGTREGFVEVAAEEVERYEGSAEPVVIDGPTPPALRRKVLGRDGGRCANPRCSHPADHCHHVKFRSRGGKTCLANEVAVCATCHALVHAGLLKVTGNADGKLRWSPVGGPSLEHGASADTVDADNLPESADADTPDPLSPRCSSGADAGRGLDLEALARGLVRLGVPVARSRQIIYGVVKDDQPPDEMTEADVLRRALASL